MCIDGLVGQEDWRWSEGFRNKADQMFEEYGDIWCVQCFGLVKDVHLFPSVDHYNLHLAVKHVDYLKTCAYTLPEIEKVRQDLQVKLGM